jgi:hypothetical protein
MNEQKAYEQACAACLQNCFNVLSSAIAVNDGGGGETRFRRCRKTCLETLARVRSVTETPLANGDGPGDNAPVANHGDTSLGDDES